MNNKLTIGLIAAVIFQFLVLTGMYVKAAVPLWTGQEVKVKTVPVDPRSLFRGNYARLSYSFSRVDSKYFPDEEALRSGDIVYIALKEQQDGLYVFSDASLQKPTSEIFLRGRVSIIHFPRHQVKVYNINYGIEAFFAPKKEALALEKQLRDGGIAVLMVGSDGRARIKDVIGQ